MTHETSTSDSDSPSQGVGEKSQISAHTARTDPHWSRIFPFESPYENQKTGIRKAIKTGKANGFMLLEGACGTGKTLLALSAAISLLRGPESDINQIVAITNFKQQQEAFETDLTAINDQLKADSNAPRPLTGVSVVGKGDVCPYSQAGAFDKGEVYSRCTPLRQSTRSIVHDNVNDEGARLPDSSVSRAMTLVSQAQRETTTPAEIDDTVGPFSKTPHTRSETEFCPYYAQYLGDDIADADSIPVEGRILTTERLMEDAVQYGTCPHTTMRDAMLSGEVVIANYQHIFDPTTVDTFSEPLIDDETLLIVDEAHTLVKSVREQLSTNTTHTTLVKAADECKDVLDWVTGRIPAAQSIAEQTLEMTDITRQDVAALRTFLDDLADEVARRVELKLQNVAPGVSPPYTDLETADDKFNISLRAPDDPGTDDITAWMHEQGYDEELLADAREIGEAIAKVKSIVKREVEDKTGDGTKFAKSAGDLLTEWYEADNSQYFREIRITDRGLINDDYQDWKTTLRAELWINNCIPASEIATRLDDFAAGILMSATLAPLDVYEESVGLQYLTDRPVSREVFGLNFPPQNRLSLAVDLPPFTWNNRHDPFDPPPENDPDYNRQQIDQVRTKYRNAIINLVQTTPGNTLIFMPSYKEAKWAKECLDSASSVEKEVLVDTSSDTDVTDALKEEFFAGPPKVMTSSLRGTLTEGVDFAGDRLEAVAVVGVPIVNYSVDRVKALKTAYENGFGDGVGFRYGFTVPAVRKARQALGRVIRSQEDIGTRILLDSRYVEHSNARNKVWSLFPSQVQTEFESIHLATLNDELNRFWKRHK